MANQKNKKVKKKFTKRSSKSYPALDVSVNLKTRSDLIDYDYVDKLSDNDKKWLNKFTEEYTNASFKKDGKDIQKKKEHRKDAYDRNNARNRCIYTKSKAFDNLDYLEDINEKLNEKEITYEDKIIEVIDEERDLLKKFDNLKKPGNSSDGTDNESN